MTDDDPVLAHLESLDFPFEILACDPALADTAAFCEAYGFELADSANAIVVVGKSTPRIYAACIVLATTRLDVNGAVKARLGTRKASFASAEETAELTGMAIGGVTPFGLPPELPVWVDARVMERERIVLGGGSRDRKVLAGPRILTRLPQCEVVESLATDPPAPRPDPDPGAHPDEHPGPHPGEHPGEC
jgi:prolyl-tRNA editing enzyme YbaK/EbsC (Cys-tRNA(Pro) deacylase)